MDKAEGSELSAGKDAASHAATGRNTASGRAARRASPAPVTSDRALAPDAWSRQEGPRLGGGAYGFQERVRF